MIPFFTLLTLVLPLVAASHLPPPHKRSSHERARKNFDLIHANSTEVEAEDHSLARRGPTFSGTGTFYYTGLGACGQNSVDSDFMVALNSAQYGGGYPGPQCFKSITVQANGKTVGGVTILDECPTCGYGSLDLSPGLFSQFADFGAGVVSITWWFNDDAPAEPTSTTPTSTWQPPTSTWVAPTTTSTWHEPSTSSTSEWVAPSTSSTTPAQTSTSTQAAWSSAPAPASSSTSSTITSSSISSTIAPLSSSATSTIARNSTNPFVVVGTNATATASASATATDGSETQTQDTQADLNVHGNLEAFNALAAQYGQLVVIAAEAAA